MPWIPLRDGQQLYVRTLGRGKPVVLVHGFASSSLHWLPNVWPLRHQYQFILPDLRGFGHSNHVWIDEEKVFELYARDLADVLDHFQLDQVALGGISTGAYVCLTLNQHHGFQRFGKYLNIEHTPQSRNNAQWQHGLFSEKQDELFASFRRLHAMALEAGVHTPYWELPENVRKEFALTLGRVLARAVNNSATRMLVRAAARYGERLLAGPVFPVDNWFAYLQVMQAFMEGNDTFEGLGRITVPTTLMIGKQSRFFSAAGQLEIQHHVPHAHVVVFKHSGHIPMLDQPIRFQREFSRFLAS